MKKICIGLLIVLTIVPFLVKKNEPKANLVLANTKIIKTQLKLRDEIRKESGKYVDGDVIDHIHDVNKAKFSAVEFHVVRSLQGGGFEPVYQMETDVNQWRPCSFYLSQFDEERQKVLGKHAKSMELDVVNYRTIDSGGRSFNKFRTSILPKPSVVECPIVGVFEDTLYYVRFGNRDRNSTFFKIPKGTKVGETVIVNLDITDKQDWWKEQPSYLSGTVSGLADIDNYTIWYNIKGRRSSNGTKVMKNGSFRTMLVSKQVGEVMCIKKGRKYCTYFTRDSKSNKVNFPEDADIVALDEDVLEFSVRIPKGVLHKDTKAIKIIQKREDELALCWSRVENAHEGTVVKLNFIPGTYYLVYRNSRAKIQEAVFGKITLKSSDVGKVLEYQPLE